MMDQHLPSTPDAKSRLLKMGGKTIAAAVSHLLGIGLAGEALEILGGYFSDYLKDKRNRRARDLCQRIERSKSEARKALEAEEGSDPLVDVFLTVLHDCVGDDEDEKVAYYAALLLGLAEAKDRVNQHEKTAMLQAMKILRVHDLYVMDLVAHLAAKMHNYGVYPHDIGKPSDHPRSITLLVDLIPQGLSALVSQGLLLYLSGAAGGGIPQGDRYQVTKFGLLMWGLVSKHLDPAPPGASAS